MKITRADIKWLVIGLMIAAVIGFISYDLCRPHFSNPTTIGAPHA